MRPISSILIVLSSLAVACGGGASSSDSTASSSTSSTSSGDEGEAGGGESGSAGFEIHDSDTAGSAHGDHPSEIEATRTHAAMRLFVVDADSGPVVGVVIKMTAPNGAEYYTDETDSVGYAEVLVPVGQRYEIEYLSLGRRSITSHVEVPEGPNQDIRLTMRYRFIRPAPRVVAAAPSPEAPVVEEAPEPGFVLEGILFESGNDTIQPESFPRLDRVVEYLTHHGSARIRIAGHTDNVGNARVNQRLSEARAQAVRSYLVEHGIDGDRIEAVGYGDTQPVAPNDTEEGRQRNRRIEAVEL